MTVSINTDITQEGLTMNTVVFSVWKFKNIEGLIECNGYDFNTTKIKDSDGRSWFIKYDVEKETCTIMHPDGKATDCTFKDIVNKLKDFGLWIDLKEKHSTVVSSDKI